MNDKSQNPAFYPSKFRCYGFWIYNIQEIKSSFGFNEKIIDLEDLNGFTINRK